MLKKIATILSVLMLVSCTANKNQEIQKDYIDPVMDIFIFDELNDDYKETIKKANSNKDYKNAQFKMLNKEVYSDDLVDIDGNIINLTNFDEFVLEVASVGCDHCSKLISEHLEYMLSKGVRIIQYFNDDKEDIISFYDDIGMEVPKNLIVICKDDELYDYLHDYLVLEAYPTLISYKDSKVSFETSGDMDNGELDAYFDISFNNTINDNSEILSVISTLRTKDDVKKSFSKENLDKLNSLDNDSNTVDYTLSVIGKKLNFDRISNSKSSVYINEIDSFDEYKDKNLALIYTNLGSEEDASKIKYINKLINSNDTVKYIVVLIEGLESSTNIYNNLDVKFAAPVVSVLGYIPDDFFTIGFRNYPSALFVEKGTFTGAYSNINSIENFNKAIDMFIGDNSIALKINN